MRRPLLAVMTTVAVALAACSGSDPSTSRRSSSADSSGTGNDAGTDNDADVETTKPRRRDTTVPPAPVAVASVALPAIADEPPLTCPAATTTVSTADQLASALDGAQPGDVIALEPGDYDHKFVAATAGTADAPIWLCGERDARLDAGGVRSGYGLHLDGASHWRVVGFTVHNAQKGVVADGVSDTVIQGLLVEDIGDEAIHLRATSTANVVQDNEIRRTGQRRDKFGEGVYVGTAQSNWCTISDCRPDPSDGNVVQRNDISATTAEAVDIKEGTTGGVVRDNRFDGAALSGADSWVDVKGNGWLIEGNTGTSTSMDGFQLHEIVEGWGTGNVFTGNVARVDGPGYGFATTNTTGNVVRCDNEVSGAAKGAADIDCT